MEVGCFNTLRYSPFPQETEGVKRRLIDWSHKGSFQKEILVGKIFKKQLLLDDMEDYDKSLDANICKILTDKSAVCGDIYLITNTLTNKKYVGQTLSHRLNHGKYRPFGFQKRFDDHKSQARTDSTKTSYLINSVRKDGEEHFKIQLIVRCKAEDMDNVETFYIYKYNTLYPHGYNLTTGGKSTLFQRVKHTEDGFVYNFESRRRTYQSDETKKKISTALKEFLLKEENAVARSSRVKNQHMVKRQDMFDLSKFNVSNPMTHFYKKKQKGRNTYIVKIGDKKTQFWSKHEDDDEVKQRAIDFLNSLVQRHGQIAGTS